MASAIGVGLLLWLIVTGMPIGFALLVAGAISLLVFAGAQVVTGILSDVVYNVSANYVLLTIPMFILMSEFLSTSGIANDLVDASYRWFGRLRGGLGIACVIAGAVMAAVVGSSTASTATMSTATFPSMRRIGYKDSFSLGIIAISGTLAILIPPSIVLVVYGILTEESIGKLLVAGIVPGVLTALGYIVTILVMVKFRPEIAPRSAGFDLRGAMASTRHVWPVMLLIVIVMGSLYSGVATPTEVGAIGAAAAFVIIFLMGRMSPGGLRTSLSRTARTTAMILVIIIGAMVFGYFMTFTQLTQKMVGAIAGSGLSRMQILLLVVGVYLVLGMFLDQFAILVLTVPISYALIRQLGFDGIWFGIIITKTVEIGLVSPPVGLNVFIASNITGVPLREAFRGVAPFILTEIVIMAILVGFPEISTFLPKLMR
jgi:C4-dicarboxylate transporter DctM subunit